LLPSPVRGADEVVPDLVDVVRSLQVVAGIPVSGARDVTQDGKINLNDVLYAMQYMLREIWADPTTELAIAETLEQETLEPRDTSVTGISADDEDALARAVVAANQAELQSVILFNAFYMADPSTTSKADLLNRYRALTQGFEIAGQKYDEIIRIHQLIEAANTRSTQEASRTTQELTLDAKLQWYIDHYGKTTPAGHKIDIKTIAERNKISVQKVHTILRTVYGVVKEIEEANAIQSEAAEKTATEIKETADTANTALSFVSGGQAAMGVFKAVKTLHTTKKMYQAGQLGYKTAEYIAKTQGKNIIKGAIEGGFSFGDGILGVLTSPTVFGAFGPEWQANLNKAKAIWSALSVAKGLTYDAYCVLSVKDAFTGKSKLIISNLTDFTKTSLDTMNNILSITQTEEGKLVQAVQRPADVSGEALRKDLVYSRLSTDNMLPNGAYSAKDENDTATSFAVTASKVTSLLPNLSGDDLLFNATGDIREGAPPPYEYYCGWYPDFTLLTVVDHAEYPATREYLNAEGKTHGPSYRWTDSTRGQLEYALCYKDGVRHGSSTEWYINGQKYVTSNYANGVLHGSYTAWYSNGVKDMEGTYADGKKTGLWTDWYYTGVKASEGRYVAYQYDGPWTFWWKNGKLKQEVNYVLGKEHGSYKTWFDTGNIQTEGQYANGTEVGIWTYYYRIYETETDIRSVCQSRYDYDHQTALDCP
jgi:antitoxin component YwqK of YwqJK toxin-antitoxin module/putative intracellular protease/amidase